MNINQITDTINSFFQYIDNMITKTVPMPAILLLCSAMSRPGLSPLRSLSNVCEALEKLGVPMGANPDGSPNLIIAYTHALFQETYRALAEDAVVQGGVQAGEMQIQSQGSNSAGPVMSTGTNLLPVHLWGIMN